MNNVDIFDKKNTKKILEKAILRFNAEFDIFVGYNESKRNDDYRKFGEIIINSIFETLYGELNEYSRCIKSKKARKKTR